MSTQLKLRPNNLYVNGKLITFPTSGEALLLRDPIKTEGSVLDRYHTVQVLDRLDKIAWKYYGDQFPDASKYWWVIADANEIHDPTDISDLVGTELLIPDLANVKLKL